jgi:hypothetical protein
MNDAPAPIRRAHQLWQQSQKLRADSIRTQIICALCICDIVEMKSKWESKEDARQSIFRLWRHIEVMRRHIHKPDHISADAREQLLALFSQLDSRASEINESLRLVS